MATFIDEEKKDKAPETQAPAPAPAPAPAATDPVVEALDKSNAELTDNIIADTEAFVKKNEAEVLPTDAEYQRQMLANELQKPIKSTADMIKEMENERKKQLGINTAKVKEDEEAAKRDYRTQVFGDITEAASALVNLFGTTQGAKSATINSPTQQWAQRAAANMRERDALRRERDAKLDNLKGQLDKLKQQKDALTLQRATKLQEFDDKQIATMLKKMDLANDAAKTQADNTHKAVEGARKSQDNYISKRAAFISKFYGDTLRMPTDKEMQEWDRAMGYSSEGEGKPKGNAPEGSMASQLLNKNKKSE